MSNQGHTIDVAHLHPLTNVPTKYQLPTPYGFRDIAWTRFYRSRSLRQGQIKVRPSCCTPTPPNQCPYQVSTFYTLRFLRYNPDKFYRPRSLRQGQRSNQSTNFFLPPTRQPILTPWVKTIPLNLKSPELTPNQIYNPVL